MTPTVPLPTPAYVVCADGSVRLNDAGKALRAQHELLKEAIARLEQSLTRATMCALFMHHPWVDTITVLACASWQYDDEGGSYVSGSCTVTDVRFSSHTPPPATIFRGAVADFDEAADLLTDALEEDSGDVALALLNGDWAEGRQFTFNRATLFADGSPKSLSADAG